MIRILETKSLAEEEIFARSEEQRNVAPAVSEIIASVRKDKDKALFFYTEKFDGVKLESMAVSEKEIEQAVGSVDPKFIAVLMEASENIAHYHEQQVRSDYTITDRKGRVLGQKVLPLEKVGVYVPGGTAAYPSTVLMDTIPARIAGVNEIIMVTPPAKDGSVNPNILAAAYVAGVNKIYKVGGAQAIAALAYGTESIPAVDKIVGPMWQKPRSRYSDRSALTWSPVPVKCSSSPTAVPIRCMWRRICFPRPNMTVWQAPCSSPIRFRLRKACRPRSSVS